MYYYAVVASNDYGKSSSSNVESVDFQEGSSGFSGLFSDLNWGEIIILGGFLGALQIIFAVVIVVTKSASKPSSKSAKGKRK